MSTALSAAILQTAMDGFWVADLQGRLLEVNEAYIRMSGYSRAELLELGIGDLEASASPAETAELAAGRRVFLAIKFPLVDAGGAIYGVGAISHDITERQRADAAMANMQKLESLGTLAGGFSGVLSKPYVIAEVSQALAQVLPGFRRAPGPEKTP